MIVVMMSRPTYRTASYLLRVDSADTGQATSRICGLAGARLAGQQEAPFAFRVGIPGRDGVEKPLPPGEFVGPFGQIGGESRLTR